MSLSLRLPVLLAPLVLLPCAAFAQMPAGDHAMDCGAPAPLPEALAGWRVPVPIRAAGGVKGVKDATLTPGKAAALALLPTPRVTYVLRPEKPGGSVSFGGLAAFAVDRAGTWRVALSSGAWVDVVKDGKAMTSVAHGHGPECTGVRKMVDYDLEPGRYTLQVAANGAESLTVMVTRLP